MDRIKIDDLQLRAGRRRRSAWSAGPACARRSPKGMPDLEKAVGKYDLDEYYGKALGLVLSGQARERVRPDAGEAARSARRYGKNTFGQCCLLARRLIEAGTRFVEVNWPKVANSRQPLVGRPRRPVRRA